MSNATMLNGAAPSMFEGYTLGQIEAMRLMMKEVKLPPHILGKLASIPMFSGGNTASEIQRIINTVPPSIEGAHSIQIVCKFADLVRMLMCFCPAEAGDILAGACREIRSACYHEAFRVWDISHDSEEEGFDDSSVQYPIDHDTCVLLAGRVMTQTKEALIADMDACESRPMTMSIQERRNHW